MPFLICKESSSIMAIVEKSKEILDFSLKEDFYDFL